jgi:hypothetical protein
MMMTSRSLVLAACAGACSSAAPIPVARFANAPIARAVDDRLDVPKPPAKREFYPDLYNYDGAVQHRLWRALDLPRAQRALGVNALDEVPDSTWFTNRIGVRELTPDQVRRGPVTVDSPELHLPWTVHSTKTGGSTVGLMITDARGIKYLLKFDDKGSPELETGFDVIANRLIWAAGYNVPEDQIVYFRDGDIVVAKDAVAKNLNGDSAGAFDQAQLARVLAGIERGSDGRFRGLLTRWISGKTIGGYPSEGVRKDDPNDRIPHELRRDLRGAYSVFAWVDHVDIQEGNFVDTWIADPQDPHRHYVEHYLIDFGRSLGAMAYFQFDWRRSHMYVLDFSEIARSLFTFGLAPRPWIDRPIGARSVGTFEATTFEPGNWHPDWPSYLPLRLADRFDKFWGAKIVARFTRAQIAAAVDAGRLTSDYARNYIVDSLLARQHATSAYWFSRVNPLDRFDVVASGDGLQVCFDDLAVLSGVASAAATRYELASWDWSAKPVARGATADADEGRACGRIAAAAGDDRAGYTVIGVTTRRPGFTGTTYVHVGRDPVTHAPRVIGIYRT